MSSSADGDGPARSVQDAARPAEDTETTAQAEQPAQDAETTAQAEQPTQDAETTAQAEQPTQDAETTAPAGQPTEPAAFAAGPAPLPLDWYDFAGREVPEVPGEFFSPESELVAVARHAAEDLQAAELRAQAAADEVREALFDLAVLVGRLDQLADETEEPLAAQGRRGLHQQLSILRNQMRQTLADNAIELRDPTGLPAAEVLDWTRVNTWLHRPEFAAEVVARTEEHAVFHEGRIVRRAQVQMGAPAESDHEQDTAQDGGPR